MPGFSRLTLLIVLSAPRPVPFTKTTTGRSVHRCAFLCVSITSVLFSALLVLACWQAVQAAREANPRLIVDEALEILCKQRITPLPSESTVKREFCRRKHGALHRHILSGDGTLARAPPGQPRTTAASCGITRPIAQHAYVPKCSCFENGNEGPCR